MNLLDLFVRKYKHFGSKKKKCKTKLKTRFPTTLYKNNENNASRRTFSTKPNPSTLEDDFGNHYSSKSLFPLNIEKINDFDLNIAKESNKIPNPTKLTPNLPISTQVSNLGTNIDISSDSSSDESDALVTIEGALNRVSSYGGCNESSVRRKLFSSASTDLSLDTNIDSESDGESIEDVYDWLGCNTNEGLLSTKCEGPPPLGKSYNSPLQTDCENLFPRNKPTPLRINDSNNCPKSTPKFSSPRYEDNTVQSHGNAQTPTMKNVLTSSQYSSKTMFTPPTPQCDSPLETEALIICQQDIGIHVRDTKKVTRKKACLPKSKPNAKKGDWLTNRTIVNNYILLNLLGKGSYGEVRLCKEKNSNKLCAIKIMNRELLNKKTVGKNSTFMDDVKREIAIMKKLRHENVLRLFEVMDDPKVNKVYLVLDYMKRGDLCQIGKILGTGLFSDEQVWDITRQVLRGLKYLHDNNIVHGDIKPQNILCGNDGMIKIADYSLSKICKNKSDLRLETLGTPAFMAPEICAGKAFDGQQADMYAVGATMYFIRFGKPPFDGKNIVDLYAKIQKDPIVFPFEIPDGLKSFIGELMKKDPSSRLTIVQAMKYSWLQKRPRGISKVISRYSPINQSETSWQQSQYKKVEVSREDILESIHAASTLLDSTNPQLKSDLTEDRQKCKDSSVTMTFVESEQRIRTFQSKLDHDKVITTMNNQKGFISPYYYSSDDTESEISDEERLHSVDDIEFGNIMATLSCQPKRHQDSTDESRILRSLKMSQLQGGLFQSSLNMRSGHYSGKGVRQNQEDRLKIVKNLCRYSLANNGIGGGHNHREISFFALFDGHNGSHCAHLLSEKLHKVLIQNEHFPDNLEKSLHEAFITTDSEVYDELLSMKNYSGSTAIVVCTDSKLRRIYIASVGDSRCVMSTGKNGDIAMCLTTDHRTSIPKERERIIASGGILQKDRVNGVLAVTRAFGNIQHRSKGASSSIEPIPDIKYINLSPFQQNNDDECEFYIIATDGLWDIMGKQQVINFIRLQLTASDNNMRKKSFNQNYIASNNNNNTNDVNLVAKKLVEEALRLGSVDNISVIILFLNGMASIGNNV